MALEEDNDILQDFLVEAGEILESLSEQLVQLEQNPEDTELLNAVFRGFHTVKGGAGFLNIQPMIAVCHRAEDVFNVLRQGARKVSAELMDSILRVLDILNEQFKQLSAGEPPIAAEESLLKKLELLAKPADTKSAENVTKGRVSHPKNNPIPPASPAVPVRPSTEKVSNGGKQAEEKIAVGGDDITEAEFESLLEALEADGKAPHLAKKPSSEKVDVSASVPGSDDITDSEFETLLDELHGTSKHATSTTITKPHVVGAQQIEEHQEAPDPGNISEAEFEHLLDEIHGKGKIDTATITKLDIERIPTAKIAKQHVKSDGADGDDQTDAVVEDAHLNKQKGSKANVETTVRVDTKRLDDIMNMVGELVLVRNRLDTLKVKINDEEISKAVGNLGIVTSDLQAAVMKTRMQPIKKVFGRFPRVVRDLARSLNKEVNLELMGEDTDLDKNLVEALADPMVHLVRNAVDHGIEMPAVRTKGGKNAEGTIVLSAAQEGDHILLTIEDDGAGMDAEVLKRKAVEKGVIDVETAARMSEHDAFHLIFAPGFSTKSEISDISGRGVGMDVVKTRISQLNGTVDVDSRIGRGTRISITLPLTLAILPTLMVKVCERTFALPLSSVNEIFSLATYNKNTIDGQLVIVVRNKAMPLFYLYKWLGRGKVNAGSSDNEQVVVANVGNQRVGFVVNQVVGQEEVVIKPLGAMLHGLAGFAGATITGDGRIALILDIPSLMKARVKRA